MTSSSDNKHPAPQRPLRPTPNLGAGLLARLTLTIALLSCQSTATRAQTADQKSNTPSQAQNAEQLSLQLVRELDGLQREIQQKAQRLTLQEAITTGLINNPKLLETFSTIQQYEWQLIAAKRTWYPSAQLSNGTPFAGYSWQTFVGNQYGQPVIYGIEQPGAPVIQTESNTALKSGYAQFQPGVSVSWNFIDPTRQPNINAASESLRQQKLLFDVGARNLILNIQQSYFQIQSTEQLIKSFIQIYAINKQQLETINAQRSIGMVTVLDLEQTRSQLFIQLNQLVQFTRDYIAQTARLAEALGLPQGSLAVPSEPARPSGSWSVSLNQTITQAIQKREEIQASLAAAESAKWSGIAAIRTYFPVFQLVGTGSLTAQDGYLNAPVSSATNPYSATNRTWAGSAGLGFTWTFFDGGVNAASSQAAFALSRQKKAEATSTELQIEQQVRSSYGQYLTSKVALTSAQQALLSAEKAQEASRARFAVGVGDITSVVQTIQQLSQASEQLSQAVLSHNISVAELYRYSATWPINSQQEVLNRLRVMRTMQGQTPAPGSRQP